MADTRSARSSKLDAYLKAPQPVPSRKPAKKKVASRNGPAPEDEIKLPPDGDWRTTDEDEINRRRLRAREEIMKVTNLRKDTPLFSSFRVDSPSGFSYTVEIQDVANRVFTCSCTDYRINGLGTCKHIESVLAHLEKRLGKLWAPLCAAGSPRAEISWDRQRETLATFGNRKRLPVHARALFGSEGLLSAEWDLESAYDVLLSLRGDGFRLSQSIAPQIRRRQQAVERTLLRRDYEKGVRSGLHPQHETLMPLYPYQREGMLHLAFAGRAMLADEMGLGKTIQAIAACALLHRLGKARRVLVVCPASLKTEWEEQIRKFTTLDYQIVYGSRKQRNLHYREDAPFFTLMNYEQVRTDVLDLNARLKPDIVVLDEAQRIKNWASKTARSIKLLESPYAFVLTGTPLENRIDELYSLVDFLDPEVFGSLFRFNRQFYELDEKGRPQAARNLNVLHSRVRPLMLRRRKSEVEDELPGRSDENRFVPMTEEQAAPYEDLKTQVAKLAAIAKRRPLRKEEHEKLMMLLAQMRMICDTVYILDQNMRECPKLDELRSILEDGLTEDGVKVIIFSEWVRMLELVRGLLEEMGIGFAVHTGQIHQKRRRAELIAFKTDPNCRVLLCTESGGTGLNLQNASVVINCDLPWNPAKLEQRIARAWRKHQQRAVTVINLVTENSIEHGMLETLAMKQGLSDRILDQRGEEDRLDLRGGNQSFLKRLQLMLSAEPEKAPEAEKRPALPPDRPTAFADECARVMGAHLIACEERFPIATGAGTTIAVIVDRDAASWQPRLQELHEKILAPVATEEPSHLVVLDRATVEALEALQKAGLIQRSERAIRPLNGAAPAGAPAPAPLTEQEKAQIQAHADVLRHRLKVARALLAADLAEDAVPPLREATLAATRALGIRQRVTLPEHFNAVTQSPWRELWPLSAQPLLLVSDPVALATECQEVLQRLDSGC